MTVVTTDGTAGGTVEWGEERRTGWLDRLLGEPDEVGRRRVSGVALGCALVAVALLVASVLTPWMTGTERINGPLYSTGDDLELYVEDIQLGSFGYQFGWLVLLALVGFSLVAGDRQRRLAIGTGLGCAAGMLVMVAGQIRQISAGGSRFLGDELTDVTIGPGAYFGALAVVVAAAAIVLSGRQPGRRPGAGRSGDGRPGHGRLRPARDTEPEVEPGPADLTVTPLEPEPDGTRLGRPNTLTPRD